MATAEQTPSSSLRPVVRVVRGMETSDGAGVNLVRVIGTPQLDMLDPFLMLDAFRSDDPQDYIAGFPPHPHRGFETITYLLAGHMEHEDNAGHKGVIRTGGVQWMTAGRGIIHSEMPVQEEGLLSGFQLWLNLPASHKMIAPRYQELEPEQIPLERRGEDVEVRVIAGTTSQGTVGAIKELITPASYFDVKVSNGASFEEPLDPEHNVLVHLFEGEVEIETERGTQTLRRDELAQLGEGERLSLHGDGRLLLLSGKPLREPVARRGPFVMNTQEELMQAFHDYQSGKF